MLKRHILHIYIEMFLEQYVYSCKTLQALLKKLRMFNIVFHYLSIGY